MILVGYYLLADSLLFQRRFFFLHFLHLVLVDGFRAPQLRHIFKYNLCLWAILLLTMSVIGMKNPLQESIFLLHRWIE